MKTKYYSVNGIIQKPRSKKKRILNKWWKKVVCWSEARAVTGVDTSMSGVGCDILLTDYNNSLEALKSIEEKYSNI